MSLVRQVFREMRPIFRMLEGPFGGGGRRLPVSRGSGNAPANIESSALAPFGIFDPFFTSGITTLPPLDVKEEPNAFVVEAELPGVKKENVDLRIGDDRQSVTIEGRTAISTQEQPAEGGTTGEQQVVTSPTTLTSERTFAGESAFSRTIWLPRRVDPSGVSAKLEDGILTVRIPKAEQQSGVKVDIE